MCDAEIGGKAFFQGREVFLVEDHSLDVRRVETCFRQMRMRILAVLDIGRARIGIELVNEYRLETGLFQAE